MAMQAHEIEELIIKAFPYAVVKIEDMAGDGDHYSCFVESELFAGKTRIQQHQMVYQALDGRMCDQLHALALQTKIPK